MSKKIASLYAEIGGNTTGLKTALNQSQSMLGKFSGTVANMLKNAFAGYLGIKGIELLGKGLTYSMNAAKESQQASAQLGAVLKSTGGAAGMTADSVDDLAWKLSNLTAVDDDLIVKNSAVMLTFTSVGKEIFPTAMQAALDLSTALGQDLQSSVVQLGKALNDPITGITALKRVGVSFSVEQRKTIETLVESNDLLGAQTIILDELQKEFGGVSKSAGDTSEGSFKKLGNAVENTAEGLGGPLLDSLGQVADALTWQLTHVENAKNMFEMYDDRIKASGAGYAEYRQRMLAVAKMFGYVNDEELDLIMTSGDLVAQNQLLNAIGIDTQKQFYQNALAAGKSTDAITQSVAGQYDTYEDFEEALGSFSHTQQKSWDDVAEAAKKAGIDIMDVADQVAAETGKFDIGMTISRTIKTTNITTTVDGILDDLTDLNDGTGKIMQDIGDKYLYKGGEAYNDWGNIVKQATGNAYLDEYKYYKGVEKLFNDWRIQRVTNPELADEKFKQDYQNLIAGMTQGIVLKADYSDLETAKELIDGIVEIGNQTFTYTIIVRTIGALAGVANPYGGRRTFQSWLVGNSGRTYAEYLAEGGDDYTTRTGWAQGGSFIVPAGYPNDSYRPPINLTSGERVDITPANKAGSGGAMTFYGPVYITAKNQQTMTALMSEFAGAA